MSSEDKNKAFDNVHVFDDKYIVPTSSCTSSPILLYQCLLLLGIRPLTDYNFSNDTPRIYIYIYIYIYIHIYIYIYIYKSRIIASRKCDFFCLFLNHVSFYPKGYKDLAKWNLEGIPDFFLFRIISYSLPVGDVTFCENTFIQNVFDRFEMFIRWRSEIIKQGMHCGVDQTQNMSDNVPLEMRCDKIYIEAFSASGQRNLNVAIIWRPQKALELSLYSTFELYNCIYPQNG